MINLLSEKYIKENSILDENLNSKLIKITLREVQDIKLKPILGAEKYNELIEEYTKYTQNKSYIIDPELVKLKKEYINDFLIYSVLYDITTALNYKFTNKGTKTITDANASDVTLGEVESVKKYYRAKMDTYKLRLIEYLDQSCGTGSPKKSGFTTGFYIKSEPNSYEIAKARSNKTGWRFR